MKGLPVVLRSSVSGMVNVEDISLQKDHIGTVKFTIYFSALVIGLVCIFVPIIAPVFNIQSIISIVNPRKSQIAVTCNAVQVRETFRFSAVADRWQGSKSRLGVSNPVAESPRLPNKKLESMWLAP
jgi:hypothetical protein